MTRAGEVTVVTWSSVVVSKGWETICPFAGHIDGWCRLLNPSVVGSGQREGVMVVLAYVAAHRSRSVSNDAESDSDCRHHRLNREV